MKYNSGSSQRNSRPSRTASGSSIERRDPNYAKVTKDLSHKNQNVLHYGMAGP